ncbi:hypothetical protein MLD63_02225 (plasmid) [Paracoccus sp. TK19116]|uniref:Nodulation protein NodH n=1 Tax=Paracoccus albicereus TaxID=2922394 RepID=A0ABT1MLS7_9RHOB|nr:hypothetical protein [Paracoccus albicereus]MCQ0969254.1 hypothetical protein [Paracoccus albicereus]
MAEPFGRFVIFAGMRTGSNLLEATLNGLRGVTCFGEAFNPYMLGWPGKAELQGITMAEREADPHRLLATLFDRPDHLPGFRYFHDHDPRVFDAIIEDRSCAKIILSRSILDSYVSTRLAWETNQWKLNESEVPVPAAIEFKADEFRQVAAENAAFQSRILGALQRSGQVPFLLDYADLRDADVLRGLLHWLGRTDLEEVRPAQDQVPQNPREMRDKVTNYDDMQRALVEMDLFGTTRIPSFETSRGPAVPSYMASDAGRGLLFMPVRGAPSDRIAQWLATQGDVQRDFTQKTLRQWKRGHPGHRSFTILRHPLLRAWQAFRTLIVDAKPELRQVLRDVHRVSLPPDDGLGSMTDDQQSRHFGEFLDFLRRNLNGQTSLPTHPGWASQSEVVAGFARFGSPDAIVREDRLAEDMGWLARAVGINPPTSNDLAPQEWPAFITVRAHIAAARAAYLRDYITFGFEDLV